MKNFFPVVKNLVAVLLTLVFLFALFFHGIHPPHKQDKKKTCAAAMKSLASQVELYFEEFEYKSSSPDCEELLKKGYLKNIPQCPAASPGGKYLTFAVKSNGGKIIADVECSYHGKLSLLEAADKDKGRD